MLQRAAVADVEHEQEVKRSGRSLSKVIFEKLRRGELVDSACAARPPGPLDLRASCCFQALPTNCRRTAAAPEGVGTFRRSVVEVVGFEVALKYLTGPPALRNPATPYVRARGSVVVMPQHYI